jgi:DNA ligase (NAD+)
MQIESFAEKSSEEFYNSLKEKFPLIDKLVDLGFKFEKVKEVQTPISGKKICITGALSEKRSVVEGKIREFGGIVVTSVSENTDYLLTNEKDSDSSKFVKAKKLKVPLITEAEFFKLIS